MNFRCIKRTAIAFVITGAGLLPLLAPAQGRRVAEFQITKITPNLISTPQISYSGAEQFPPQYSSAPGSTTGEGANGEPPAVRHKLNRELRAR